VFLIFIAMFLYTFSNMYIGLAKVASNNQNIANEIENSNGRHDYFTIAIRDYGLEWQALGLRYYLEGQT
jgi:hypothetical protein